MSPTESSPHPTAAKARSGGGEALTAHSFDVIVAGAGPAGSATALCLARAGASVALVNPLAWSPKARGGATTGKPPLRVGESLAPAIREPLTRLGLWDRFAAAGHRPAYAVRSAWGSAEPYDQDHIFNPYGEGWHVDRREFDRMLADAAVEAGSKRIDGTVGTAARDEGVWMVETGGETGGAALRARHLVDATGRPARIARRLGGQRHALDHLVGVVVSVPPEHTTTVAEGMTLVEAAADGWWYSARTPDDRLLVAYMTDGDLWREAARRPDPLAALLAGAPLTRQRLRTVPNEPPRVVDAASAYLSPAAGHGWLAVGDAAMAVDPLSGSGVLLALRSGMHAAAAIERELQSEGSSTGQYSAEVTSNFASYAKTRHWFYTQEQRYPTSEFWSRRLAPAGSE